MQRLGGQVIAFVLAMASLSSSANATGPGPNLPLRDPQIASYTTVGGVAPLASDITVPHWHGQFTDPTDGITYGYNMVGAEDPRNVDAGTTIVPVDLIPLRLSFEANNGFALDGTNDAALTVASPIFQPADYSWTARSFGGAGPLSAGNVGVQYEDAVMRSQFNKTGSSYHLVLGGPNVLPTQSFSVPAPKGTAYINSRGVIFALVDIVWLSLRIQELLGQLRLDPTHLPIFLTDNVVIVDAHGGWYLGYHSAARSTNGNGAQPVNTYIYASYIRAGLYQEVVEYVKDIHPLSHEIAEWAADPFINNAIAGAFAQTTFVYGCLGLLEVGDPVAFLGFTMPGNPDTRPYATGTWHPQDEAFLPWFARESPNVTSQMLQSGTGRRYTFMGDLNPFPIFRGPASHC